MSRRVSRIWVIAHRELATRGRSKAFRISTALLLLAMVAGIAIPSLLARGSGRYTVAVASVASGLRPVITAEAAIAGITVTTRPVADRAAAVALVESGAATAAVIALNFYGSYVLTGVVEEKSSRVMEVPLISGVLLWFVLGYAFFSVLYGALGALASRSEDAQAAVGPLTAFMVLAYLAAFSTIGNPRAWWVTAGSLFPPTAPMFMPLRAALTDVPAWQTAVAVALMIVAILALVRAGGRVYRGAVLRSGGRVRLRQAWHGG